MALLSEAHQETGRFVHKSQLVPGANFLFISSSFEFWTFIAKCLLLAHCATQWRTHFLLPLTSLMDSLHRPAGISSERAGSHTPEYCEGVEVVDLTGSDQDDSSRESTVEAINTGDSDLPTLEELILQARARRMAVSRANHKLTDLKRLRNGNVKGDFPAGSRAGDDSPVYSWPRGSQGEHI